ncbi:MAG: L-rhamnose mutarotase, partial [Saprospiraceae bacterium]
METKRYCYALDLKPDLRLIAEYEQYHAAVWPEIQESIRSAGIVSLEIYRTGNRLFMILEAAPDFSPERKAVFDAGN